MTDDDVGPSSHSFQSWLGTRSKGFAASIAAYLVYLIIVVILRLVPQGVSSRLPVLLTLWAPFIVAAGQALLIGVALFLLYFRHTPRKDLHQYRNASIAAESFHRKWVWLWAAWFVLYVGLACQDALIVGDEVRRLSAACRVDSYEKALESCTAPRPNLWVKSGSQGPPPEEQVEPTVMMKLLLRASSDAAEAHERFDEQEFAPHPVADPSRQPGQQCQPTAQPDAQGGIPDPGGQAGHPEPWGNVPLALRPIAHRYGFSPIDNGDVCVAMAVYSEIATGQDERRSWGSVFLNILNNFSSAMFVMLFYVLVRVPGPRDRVRVAGPEAACVAGVIAFAILEATLMVYGQSSTGLSALRAAFGFGAGIAMALFVGRLESKFIGAPTPIMVALYCYAVMQASWGGFESSPALMLAMTTLALGLKGILYVLVFWLSDTGLLLHYFHEVSRGEEWVSATLPSGEIIEERRNEQARRTFVAGLRGATGDWSKGATELKVDVKSEIGREETAHGLQDAAGPERHSSSHSAEDPTAE